MWDANYTRPQFKKEMVKRKQLSSRELFVCKEYNEDNFVEEMCSILRNKIGGV